MELIKGDLIEAFKKHDGKCVLLHQENCISLEKLGIAKALYQEFPQAHIKRDMSSNFGRLHVTYGVLPDKSIVNLYSQFYPGRSAENYCKYNGFQIKDNFINRKRALEVCLEQIIDLIDRDVLIMMPLIASGLAKDQTLPYTSDLDYFTRYVKPIIQEALEGQFNSFKVQVYYL